MMFTCLCLCNFLSPELEKNLVQNHRGNIPASSTGMQPGVQKLCLRIIYYLHGGNKLCINVVELVWYDDNWHRNRTHRRGMMDY